MALDSVNALSDEETLLLSPSAGMRLAAKAKAEPTPKGKCEAKKPKTSKETTPATTTLKGDEKKPPNAKSMKRPASAGSGASQPAMKRPAAAKSNAKKPKKVSAGKSLYKRDGVWSVKFNQKEVVRVLWMHLLS